MEVAVYPFVMVFFVREIMEVQQTQCWRSHVWENSEFAWFMFGICGNSRWLWWVGEHLVLRVTVNYIRGKTGNDRVKHQSVCWPQMGFGIRWLDPAGLNHSKVISSVWSFKLDSKYSQIPEILGCGKTLKNHDPNMKNHVFIIETSDFGDFDWVILSSPLSWLGLGRTPTTGGVYEAMR